MKQLKIPHLVTLISLLGLMLLSQEAFAQEASTKIAYVSLERILSETKMAKDAQTKLQGEFGSREKEVRDGIAKIKSDAAKLDKDFSILPEADRVRRQRELTDFDREIQRKQRELIEDTQRRSAEERGKILEKANQALKSIVDQKKLDLVVQEAVFVGPRVDITNELISVLNSK
jgi:outer membrane protein